MKALICERCGAPLSGSKCEYCGSVYAAEAAEGVRLYSDGELYAIVYRNELRREIDRLYDDAVNATKSFDPRI